MCSLALLLGLATTRCAPAAPPQTLTRSMSRADATAVQLELKMTSGNLHLSGGTGRLVDATFRHAASLRPPRFLYVERGSAGYAQIYQSLDDAPLFGTADEDWQVQLTDRVPLGCLLTLGTGKAEVDLRGLQLMRLVIRGRADELTLDLRNIRTSTSGLSVMLFNAPGVTTVYLPHHLGVHVRSNNPLIEIEGPLQPLGDDWVNAAFGNAPATVSIMIDEEAGPVRLIAT